MSSRARHRSLSSQPKIRRARERRSSAAINPRRGLQLEHLEERCLLAVAPDDLFPAGSNSQDLSFFSDHVGQETPGSWVFQGGAPVEGGQTEPNTQPNKRVTGAIHTVLAHPTNADILYVGAVNGGIWKTTNATAVNPTWVPQSDFQQSLSIAALSFDRSDPTYNTLVAATGNWSSFGANGGARIGVLKSTDGGANWSNPGSAGLPGKNISGAAMRGATIVVSSSSGGILRSTDGGATFTAIVSADFTASNRFLDLVEDLSDPTGQRLYASGEDKGIYRSDDFGATWVKITGPAVNAEMDALLTNTSNNNTEMAVHPTTGRLYVAVLISGQPRGIFHTNNGTAASPTWTRMDVPVLPQGSGIAITGVSGNGVSPITITSANHGLNTGNSVVINGVTGNTAANGLHWITRIDANTFSLPGTTGNGAWGGGGSWTRVVSPNPTVKDIDSEAGSQGSIHFSILVDPTDENILYIGGDRQDLPNPIGANDYSGSIFRGDTRIARNPNVSPSPQWDHMTADIVALDPSGGTANGTGPHADSREMAYTVDGRLVEVDDGGIFRRTNPRNNTGDWSSIASNLGTVEYHSIAFDTNSNVIIGGTQDNGTQFQRAFGNTTWDAFRTADGGAVAVDNISQAGLLRSVRYSSYQFLGSFARTVVNASNGIVSVASPSLIVTSGSPLSQQFYTPVVVNNIDGTRLLFGASNGIYESFNQGDTIAAVGTNAIAVGSRGNAIDYGGRSGGIDNEDVAYVAGGSGGVYVRQTAGGPFVGSVPPSASSIISVKMDPDEWHTAFAIDSSRVFTTVNAGGNWTNITGDLASAGASVLLSLEYISGIVDAVVVGTNLGVYASLTSSLGTWIKLGTGLPNAPAWDLDYDAADDVLIAGTLGRGAWSLSDASQEFGGVPGIDLSGMTFNATPDHLLAAAGAANASFSVRNLGDTAAGAFDIKFYLSDDSTIDPLTDILLTLDPSDPDYDASEPSAYHVTGGLATLAVHSGDVSLVVPVSDPFGTDNDYYLGMFVDADANVAEADESNNRNRGQNLDGDDVDYLDAIAAFPFFEDWEGGTSFDPYWEVIPGAQGRIMITSDEDPYQGTYHVTLDDTTDGADLSLNQLILHINLAGQTGVRLQFANKEFGDEDNPQDSVEISVDGGNSWHQIVPLTGLNSTPTYSFRSYELDGLGLTYTADTMIRFQQYDDFPVPTDGMAFDNIRVDTAPIRTEFYSDDLSANPGWATSGEWAFGQPAGLGGTEHGNPDPTGGATGTNVYGVDLAGDYDVAVGGPFYLTTSAINTTGYTNVVLRFERWLNTDYPDFAYATIDVSNNGTTWTNVFTNPEQEIADTAWQSMEVDIAAVADNQPTVYIRWGYEIGSTSAFAYSGWNIDDVSLAGTAPVQTNFGDYNDDGSVDAADYVLFRKYQGSSTTLPNDGIGGVIGSGHYDQWTANFGNSLGSGGGAAGLESAASNSAAPGPAIAIGSLGQAAPSVSEVLVRKTDAAFAEDLGADLLLVASGNSTRWNEPRLLFASKELPFSASQRDDALVAWVGSRQRGDTLQGASSDERLAHGDAAHEVSTSFSDAVDQVFDKFSARIGPLASSN
jgi:hypothetical protein